MGALNTNTEGKRDEYDHDDLCGDVQTQTHFKWRLSSVVGIALDRESGTRFLGWILALKSGLILGK